MITINSAVDSGYGYCIGRSMIKDVTISNFIKRISEDSALELAKSVDIIDNNGLIIKFQEHYYMMGNLATKADPGIKRKVINNRVNDIYHLVEILGILGILCDSKVFATNLMVGLPNKLKDEAEAMANWLKGKWEVSYLTKYGQLDKLINIQNVNVVPQSIAPIYNLPIENIEKNNIISCDIGHGTGDMCLMIEGVPSINTEYWVSVEGAKQVYSDLKKRLIKEYQSDYGIYDIPERDIQVAVETGFFKVKKDLINVTDILDDCLESYAEYIAYEMSDKYSTYFFSADYIIGAGGLFNNDSFATKLTKFLQQNKVQLAFFEDPQYSIVAGMFNLINMYYGDDLTREDD